MSSLKSMPKFSSLNFPPIISGLFSCVLLAVVLSIVLGLIFFFTPMRETMFAALASVIVVVSVFWGGRVAARLAGSKGLLLGAGVGLAFFVITGIIGIIGATEILAIEIIKKLALCLIAGALGGLLGVSERN